jgi:hypothetical protein
MHLHIKAAVIDGTAAHLTLVATPAATLDTAPNAQTISTARQANPENTLRNHSQTMAITSQKKNQFPKWKRKKQNKYHQSQKKFQNL